MTDKYGTGEEIGRIKVNEELEIVISDDGDDDCWANIDFKSDNGGSSRHHTDLPLRNDIGDEQLAKDLENLERDNYTSLL